MRNDPKEAERSAGVWPVMLTPFTESGDVDYPALGALIEWYESQGVAGLFAVCQSSEMFFLSLRERVGIAGFVKRHATVPVVASGHVSVGREDQIDELLRIADVGVDAVVLLPNRLAGPGDPEGTLERSLEGLVRRLDDSVPLGLYECPYPFKRTISNLELRFLADTGRFRFLKDTCSDRDLIRQRLDLLAGSGVRLYNANTATLLDSLRHGASGFSGVMANFHPRLYVWLCRRFRDRPAEAEVLQSALTMCSQIERQLYPVNAKAHLQSVGVPLTRCTRSRNAHDMTELFEEEVRQMARLAEWMEETLPDGPSVPLSTSGE